MKNSSLVVLTFALLFAASATAQPRQEFMKLFDPNPTNVTINYMLAPELERDTGSDTEFDQHVFDLDVKFFIPMSQRFHFSFGAGYGLRYYDYSRTPAGSVLEEDVEELQRISATPGGIYFLDRDTAVLVETTMGAYSNTEDGFKSDDLQYMGKMLLIHNLRTNFQIVAGVGITEDFDDNEFIPLLGMRSFNGNWHLSITLPVEAKASYRLSDKIYLYGGGWLSGSQYKVRSDTVSEFDVQVRDTRVGLGMDYWLMSDLRLSIEAGALLGNDAFAVKGAGASGTADEDIENAGYARFSVGLALGS